MVESELSFDMDLNLSSNPLNNNNDNATFPPGGMEIVPMGPKPTEIVQVMQKSSLKKKEKENEERMS